MCLHLTIAKVKMRLHISFLKILQNINYELLKRHVFYDTLPFVVNYFGCVRMKTAFSLFAFGFSARDMVRFLNHIVMR